MEKVTAVGRIRQAGGREWARIHKGYIIESVGDRYEVEVKGDSVRCGSVDACRRYIDMKERGEI